MAPSVAAVILMVFSEPLLVSSRALPNVVNLVLKGMSRVVNFDNWQWVFQFHFPFVQNIVQTINLVHVATFAIQKDSPCKHVYPESNYYGLN